MGESFVGRGEDDEAGTEKEGVAGGDRRGEGSRGVEGVFQRWMQWVRRLR